MGRYRIHYYINYINSNTLHLLLGLNEKIFFLPRHNDFGKVKEIGEKLATLCQNIGQIDKVRRLSGYFKCIKSMLYICSSNFYHIGLGYCYLDCY